MMPDIGKDILVPFSDVWEGNEAFLCEIYDSRSAPEQELEQLFSESLLAGAQDWLHQIECAIALQRQKHDFNDPLAARDTLEYVKQQLPHSVTFCHGASGWDDTDRLIARARDLEAKQEALLKELEAPDFGKKALKKKKELPRLQRKRSQSGLSPFWTENDKATSHTSRQEDSELVLHQESEYSLGFQRRHTPGQQSAAVLTSEHTAQDKAVAGGKTLRATSEAWLSTSRRFLHPTIRDSKAADVSPFFQASHAETKQPSPKRPPGGVVSSIPFPPLDAPRFGIIQEVEACEPFWLLVVVTFLIKTNGRFAVPTFQKLRDRFPGPEQLADPTNAVEIVAMIRHLGLGRQRRRFIQKYADAFLTNPPQPGIRYRVKHYARRESAPPEGEENAEAWEIGHMTNGKYALDSWRIFCRDVLLGKAEDYNGKGARAEFQPEWMRVLPADKELRAFLRWMWMREGWEWDPETGEKRVLRREMEAAVNEGRVGYDEEGGLRILDQPRDGFTREHLVVDRLATMC